MAPSHGPPARVLPPLFFPAKSLLLPKPRGKKKHPQTTWSSLIHSRNAWSSLFPSEPRGPVSPMAAVPGFKSQRPSSFAAQFLTPPTISYTCQHPRILPALLGCHRSPGRCGPMAWSQSSPSSHTGAVTRGSCFPDTSWVEVTPISLLRAWPQLFNISMKPVKGYRYVK